MDHATSFRPARRLLKAMSILAMWGALWMPAGHAAIRGELGLSRPDSQAFLQADSAGTKELVMENLPTTRAYVEADLWSGTMRAVAQTDYFAQWYDPTGFSDSYTNARAQVRMSDFVTFSHVEPGAQGHLDIMVEGHFSKVPHARLITAGYGSIQASVTGGTGSVAFTQYFAADDNSLLWVPPDLRGAVTTGTSAMVFRTLSFDLAAGTYGFSWQLNVSGLGYDVDFGSTARTYLRLPQGVTYTSQSGVFLAAAEPLSPVPWPPMWQLTLAGLGLMASRIVTLRRR